MSELTEQRREILKLYALDKSHKEIAAVRGISIKTVQYHLDKIRRKLNCGTVGLIRFAMQKGLVK